MMEEEIRITVIATGIGHAEKLLQAERKVSNLIAAAVSPFRGAERMVSENLDVPTFARHSGRVKVGNGREVDPLRIIKAGGSAGAREETDYDIPTFLRQPVAD
jgi:hypothetical protein